MLKLPKFDQKPTDSKSRANLKSDKPKEIHTNTHHSQTSLKTKKKKPESNKEKRYLTYEERYDLNYSRFLIRNHGGKNKVAHFSNATELSEQNLIFIKNVLQV